MSGADRREPRAESSLAMSCSCTWGRSASMRSGRRTVYARLSASRRRSVMPSTSACSTQDASKGGVDGRVLLPVVFRPAYVRTRLPRDRYYIRAARRS